MLNVATNRSTADILIRYIQDKVQEYS